MMNRVLPDTKGAAELAAALEILKITCKGTTTYSLEEALKAFLWAYEIVQIATTDVEAARERLEKN